MFSLYFLCLFYERELDIQNRGLFSALLSSTHQTGNMKALHYHFIYIQSTVYIYKLLSLNAFLFAIDTVK